MSDFLHQLRSNSEYNRNYSNRNHSNRYNSSNNSDWKNNRDKSKHNGNKNYHQQQHDASSEKLDNTVEGIKNVLDGINETQKKLAIAEERRAAAEERKAEIFAVIAEGIFQALNSMGVQTSIDNFSSTVSKNNTSQNDEIIEKPSDVDREKVLTVIHEMREKGDTYGQIAQHLEDQKLPTFSGRGEWHAQTVHRICKENV
ncbi:MAG: hypothetical protein HN737_10560 [Desulfobacterales bacterium]|jgi:hypothetical protein|nr:hypothetical protein [Desulfobacteraceae bacterium]MBT4365068.1 hypothetical protein [Desulfobacteraceae bacterium]MBT7085882.1 hypothetical protein [Desulfobacterales bacterium]MBT7697836.1 hypothetical protein [Desulfobacterales bacterium]